MSILPILTFKAGQCEFEVSPKPYKVKCSPTPGYIYLYKDESELLHFCWRPRDKPVDDADNLDLIMVPGDAKFVPNEYKPGSPTETKTDGRIFVLKFTSSSQRHIFWLQSKTQHSSGDASWFSPRDLKIGQIVDRMLQGEEDIDVRSEIMAAMNSGDRRDGDDDETMEDADGAGDRNASQPGGAGDVDPGATGGDIREEGEEAREGGADGARADHSSRNLDAAASEAVQNLLASLSGGDSAQVRVQDKLYPALNDLLTPSETVSAIQSADEPTLSRLLDFLPPTTIILAQNGGVGGGATETFLEDGNYQQQGLTADTVAAAKAAMSTSEKKDLVARVLRSPQFSQSLASLTVAIRDGGLPTLADALGVKVRNGGYMRRGSGMPLGGGEAVEAFVEGFRGRIKDTEDGEERGDSHRNGD